MTNKKYTMKELAGETANQINESLPFQLAKELTTFAFESVALPYLMNTIGRRISERRDSGNGDSTLRILAGYGLNFGTMVYMASEEKLPYYLATVALGNTVSYLYENVRNAKRKLESRLEREERR